MIHSMCVEKMLWTKKCLKYYNSKRFLKVCTNSSKSKCFNSLAATFWTVLNIATIFYFFAAKWTVHFNQFLNVCCQQKFLSNT